MAPPAPTLSSLPKEIISIICWSTRINQDFNEISKELLSLALACRSTSEPALDVIWNTLISIRPLLLLLPEDLRVFRRIEESEDRKRDSMTCLSNGPQEEIVFSREPTSDDFTRWIKYSSRVRHIRDLASFGIWRMDRECLAPNVYDMLQAFCPKPFLPNLRSLSCTEGEKLTKGRQSCLWGIEIARFSRLTSFTGKRVSVRSDALLGLGRLPHLRKLSIQPRAEPSDWDELPRERHDGFFAALQELDLISRDDTHQYCTTLLNAIAPTALHSISLDLWYLSSEEAETVFTGFAAAIGGLPCPSTVHHITISVGSKYCRAPNIYNSPCFTPLLALPALRALRFLGGPQVIVDDAMLDAMSRAWPALHTLEFEWPALSAPINWYSENRRYQPPRAGAPDCPKATLAGLVPLVRRCANLRVLAVAIDMRVPVPRLDGLRCPPVARACKVSWLWTGGCVAGDDTMAVASFLSHVLPGLRHIEYSPPSWEWGHLGDVYSKLVGVRKEERKWAREHGKAIKQPASP